MLALVELTDIHFGYSHHAAVLKGASFNLSAGERLSITGPNGAGKSTLLHILVGLLKPAQGHVVAFGRERSQEKDFHEVRQRIGYVFQDPDDQLFCPTVAEDVAFGPLNLGQSRNQALAAVERVLTRLNLGHFRDRVIHTLSGGEKRLVSLATVLAMEPDVLLLDEPTNALDEATSERLIGILTGLPQAMIVISHDPHLRRRIKTRVLRLEGGRLVTPTPACHHA